MPTLPASTLAFTASQVLSGYMGVFALAFVISLAATPIMRRLAVANGIVDQPDLRRKSHALPIPYLGGVAIFLGWLAGVVVSFAVTPHNASADDPITHVSFPIAIIIGAAAVVITGLIDDIYHISPRVKVGGQLLAAAALASQQVGDQMLGARLVVDTIGVYNFVMPGPDLLLHPGLAYLLGTAIIGFLVVGGCNAMNLLDGLDGLAAGVSSISTLGFLFIALFVAVHMTDPAAGLEDADPLADPVRIVMGLAMLGAVLGFLPYNFNPASIFMGDAGSLLLGYLSIAMILLFAHTAASGPKFVTAALVVFALPIADSSLAIVRRKMRGQPIFSPDNQHLHHQLLRTMQKLNLGRNVSVKLAVLAMYLMALLFAVLGGLLVYPRMRYALAIAGLVFSFIIVIAYKAGARHLALTPPAPPSTAAPGAPGTPESADHPVQTPAAPLPDDRSDSARPT